MKPTFEEWFAGEYAEVNNNTEISAKVIKMIARASWDAGLEVAEAKCAALAAELKQSQVDAGCFKHGMEASNARLVQVAAENGVLKITGKDVVDHWRAAGLGKMEVEMMKCMPELRKALETPVTDAFLAEARRATVTLPTGYSVRPGHPINETERSVMIPKDGGQWLSRFDVEHALRMAGISIKGE